MIDERSDWIWLTASEGLRALSRLAEQRTTVAASKLERMLRTQYGSARAILLQQQIALREKAAKKFQHPETWIWTPTLLEQASDEFSSRLTSSYFEDEEQVVDVCCGAGADTLALANRCIRKSSVKTIAVDQDWLACHLCRHHAAQHNLRVDVQEIDVAQVDESLLASSGLHVDPDRRPSGKRTTNAEFFSPSSTWLEWAIAKTPRGSIKLAPASDSNFVSHLPVSRQWIGWGKSVRQQRLWWSFPSMIAHARSISVMGAQNEWRHFSFDDHEFNSVCDPDFDSDQSSMEDYVGDTDPTVRAAGLNAAVAVRVGARLIGGRNGYFSAMTPTPSVLIDWFRVREKLTLDVKKLRKHLRSLAIGVLEIKKRGVEMDPDRLRQELKLEGDNRATLFLMRDGVRRFAILADRLPLDVS